jgi:hypothetical protein
MILKMKILQRLSLVQLGQRKKIIYLFRMFEKKFCYKGHAERKQELANRITTYKTEFVADQMILSHFSNKRKEFNMERFDKIFEYFDINFDLLKLNYKSQANNI